MPNKCYSGLLQGHRGTERPRNAWKRALEKKMWTAGFRFSWLKMEMADWTELGGACGLYSTESNKAKYVCNKRSSNNN